MPRMPAIIWRNSVGCFTATESAAVSVVYAAVGCVLIYASSAQGLGSLLGIRAFAPASHHGRRASLFSGCDVSAHAAVGSHCRPALLPEQTLLFVTAGRIAGMFFDFLQLVFWCRSCLPMGRRHASRLAFGIVCRSTSTSARPPPFVSTVRGRVTFDKPY